MKTKVYLHSSKEDMWDKGEEIGLSGEALNRFKYAFLEVEFEIDVDTETGEYKILKVDGNDVQANK